MEKKDYSNEVNQERSRALLQLLNECTMEDIVWAVSRAGMWIIPFRPHVGITVGPPKELFRISRELGRLASTVNFALRSLGNRRVHASTELFELLDEKRTTKEFVTPISNMIRDRMVAIQSLLDDKRPARASQPQRTEPTVSE